MKKFTSRRVAIANTSVSKAYSGKSVEIFAVIKWNWGKNVIRNYFSDFFTLRTRSSVTLANAAIFSNCKICIT